MLLQILVSLSSIVILFVAAIGIIIFFHFRKFVLPKDKMAKKILRIFEIGAISLILFHLLFLALNLLKK
jgi:flagellar basal body-associated protein FliL